MTAARSFAAVVAVAIVAVVAWVAIDRYRSSDGPPRRPIDGDSTVMLGDSITAGGDWDELVEGQALVNEGYAGYTTAELLPVAADVAADRPDTVFVLTGTNDVRDGLPPAATVDGLAAIVDVFAETSPGTRIVIQTVLPRAETASEIVATNEAILVFAAERGLELLDLHPEFDDGSGGLRDAETTDGWHLSDVGYERWALLLGTRLASG